MAANRKIRLSGEPDRRYQEYEVATAIKPGMLAQIGSDGRISPNATSGAIVPQRIVTEQLNTLQGKTVDDQYPVGEVASTDVPMPGDRFNLLLKAGENVVPGNLLISSTDGTFIKTTGTPAQTAWQCMEALDLSVGGSVASLVEAERI